MSSELPTKAVGSPFPELYRDASRENGVPGTLIPASKARSLQEKGTDSAGVGFAAETLGASFPLQKPVAHNIVEFDDNGNMITTPMSVEAIEILRTQNHVSQGKACSPITLKEAVRLANGGKPVTVQKQAAAPTSATQPRALPGVPVLYPADPVDAPVTVPRILVRFECAFGKMSSTFSRVWRDATNTQLLILEQVDAGGMFFEAPQVETPIIVRVDVTEYKCVPATFFTLPDGQTRYTILAIEEAEQS